MGHFSATESLKMRCRRPPFKIRRRGKIKNGVMACSVGKRGHRITGGYALTCTGSEASGFSYWQLNLLDQKLLGSFDKYMSGIKRFIQPESSLFPFERIAINGCGHVLTKGASGTFAIISVFTGQTITEFCERSPVGSKLNQVRSFSFGDFLFGGQWLVFKVPGHGILCYNFAHSHKAPGATIPERLLPTCNAGFFWGSSAEDTLILVFHNSVGAVSFSMRSPFMQSLWANGTPFSINNASAVTESFFASWRRVVNDTYAEILLSDALDPENDDTSRYYQRLSDCTDRKLASLYHPIRQPLDPCKTVVCEGFLFHVQLANGRTSIATSPLLNLTSNESRHIGTFGVKVSLPDIRISRIGSPITPVKFVVVSTSDTDSGRCILFWFDMTANKCSCYKLKNKFCAPNQLLLNWRGDIQSEIFSINFNDDK